MDEDLQAVTGRKGVSGPFSPLEGFAWELKLLQGLSSAQLHKHHLWNRYKRQCTVGTLGELGSRERLILILELRKAFSAVVKEPGVKRQ